METSDHNIDSIILRSLDHQATADELSQLASWVRASDANRQHYVQQRKLYEAMHAADADFATEDELAAFHRAHIAPARPVRRLWYASASVAASVLLAAGLWFGLMRSAPEPAVVAVRAAEVFSAADSLADATLSDGSKVSIAAHSRLSVDSITANERLMHLHGKAYFQVAHDSLRPFSVLAGDVRVTVLGTKFQIDQCPDGVTVSVTEGRVRVTDTASGVSEIITARQCCTVSKGTLRRDTLRNDNFLAWRTGILDFSDTPLRVALGELSAAYNVSFQLANDSLGGQLLNARFDRTPLADVKSVLAFTLAADVTQQDGVVNITRRHPAAAKPVSK